MQQLGKAESSDLLMGSAQRLAHTIAAFVAAMVGVLSLAAIIGIFGLGVAIAALSIFIALAIAIVCGANAGSSDANAENGRTSHG